ncbi:MAG: FAD-dependent thymidylate synthase [Deltaproteobacteria bacterium]|nr:FAD-dependent thymidylate synthase [Deltaproteobacteria bacterium]
MRVDLAGYNVDKSMLDAAVDAGVPRDRLTPEVLSAAYARISRDPRPIGELRQLALNEVEKARSSNRKIIFEMGHHSVAEHAVFNFDVVGVSRLAIEWLERFRLCSYTEKSQRYITLDSDYVIPKELRDTPLETELVSLINAQFTCYEMINQTLRKRLAKSHPEMEKKKSGRMLLSGMAKEDARYITILATTGQLGLTANARNLEHIIRRLAAAPLAEVRELGQHLYEVASEVAPSILLFTEPSRYDSDTPGELEALAGELQPKASDPGESNTAVRLLHCTPSGDRMIAAALLHVVSSESFERCRKTANEMSKEDLAKVFAAALRHMEFYDAPTREFEHVAFTFEIILSSSAYAQLKRHRITSQSVQGYDVNLGVTVPPAILEAGLEDEFLKHTARAEELYHKICVDMPDVAPYVLTNAHRRRVLVTINLRELYHFARLREDSHAQWDIRNIAADIRKEVSREMPMGSLLLCGKDRYPELYKEVFDKSVAVLPPAG